jgi:hypothetical protein
VRPSAVNITTTSGRLNAETPYHPTFNYHVKLLGARWTGKGWQLDPSNEQRLRELALRVFGTDSPHYDGFTIQIDANQAWRADPIKEDSVLYFAGRRILNRHARDLPIALGAGVSLVSGDLPASGGSVKYPSLALEEKDGVVVEVLDVPADHEALKEALAAGYVKIMTVELAEREALEAERRSVVDKIDSLNARLGRIDARLSVL